MKRFLLWVLDRSAGTYLALAFLAALGLTAHAATSWDVTNEPQMYLANNITNSQTTGIMIASRQLNGSDYEYNTLTGGILRVRWGSYVEDIAFTSSTRNTTTNVVTLAGVTRNICPHFTETIVSCGNGRNWGKGAIVERNQDARLFNLKADIDRSNTFTGSGALESSQTNQPFLFPNRATTAQIAAFTYGLSASKAFLVFDTTEGVMKYWNGSSLVKFGSGSTTNMTTIVKGAGELATVADASGATILGDSGAPVLVGTNIVIRHSTGAINARNKVVATNNFGFISGSLLSNLPINKFNGGTNASSTTFWRGDGTWGNSDVDVLIASGSYATQLFCNGSEQTFSRVYTFGSSTLSAGDLYEFSVTGTGGTTSATRTHRLKLGSTEICKARPLTSNEKYWSLRGNFSVQATGASGRIHADCLWSSSGSVVTTGSTVTVNTTNSQAFQASLTAANEANCYSYQTSIILKKLTP